MDQATAKPRKLRGGRSSAYGLIAAAALGRPLPPKAVVHHVNEDRRDNRNENLVICENDAYHKLLHQRMRAYRASGHPDWLHCTFCKLYGEPAVEIFTSGKISYHRACASKTVRERVLKRGSRRSYLARCRGCDWNSSQLLNPVIKKPCPKCGGERYIAREALRNSSPLDRPRSDNRMITYQGKTQPISTWAREIGIRPGMLRWRINKLNWSLERALTT